MRVFKLCEVCGNYEWHNTSDNKCSSCIENEIKQEEQWQKEMKELCTNEDHIADDYERNWSIYCDSEF